MFEIAIPTIKEAIKVLMGISRKSEATLFDYVIENAHFVPADFNLKQNKENSERKV